MRSKPVFLTVLLTAIAIFAVVVTRDRQDERIADQLVRQRQLNQSSIATDSQTHLLTSDIYKLTNQLVVTKDEEGDRWRINTNRDASFVALPFPPTHEGSVPEAKTSVPEAKTSVPEGKTSVPEGKSSVPETDHTDPTDELANNGYLGAQACAECHQENHSGFVHTAHHMTSGLLGNGKVHGCFSGDDSKITTDDPELFFSMNRQGDRFIEKVNYADWSLEFPMSVFTGSAKSGQSFLYWYDDALFQTHISYLSALDEWIPSPGYANTSGDYSRPIRSACLECHITYIAETRPPNHFDRSTAIWGISCERCHGPGQAHVAHHRKNPSDRVAQHISQPADFSRQRQLDICGQCHSGSFRLLGDAFTFRPGDDLSQHHKLRNPNADGVGGIHTSNQLTRLAKSECFQASEMTCTTCHDPHQNQHGQTAVFTKVCLECHQPTHCGMSQQLGDRTSENCIDCHMPRGDMANMELEVASGKFTVKMIDHFIRVDQDASSRYLAK